MKAWGVLSKAYIKRSADKKLSFALYFPILVDLEGNYKYNQFTSLSLCPFWCEKIIQFTGKS